MKNLREASLGEGIRGLIDRYLEISSVQGFGLGVHWNYISLSRHEYGEKFSVEEILEKRLVPPVWRELCKHEDLPEDLSPIYVKVYISIPEFDFRAKYELEKLRIVHPNHLLILEEITPFVGLADRSKHRPIKGGISVGNLGTSNTGTLGGFVREQTAAGVPFLMSCNHVLHAPGSSAICQQGFGDGGSWAEHVGDVQWCIPLVPPTGYSYSSPYNRADVAVASIRDTIGVDKTIRGLGVANLAIPMSQVNVDDEVVFVGKESDIQYACVDEFIARKKVDIGGTQYLFGDIFTIRPRRTMYFGSLAHAGDSGSWVLTGTRSSSYNLCGVLFAGSSSKRCLCCFAEYVFDELKAQTGTQFVLY